MIDPLLSIITVCKDNVPELYKSLSSVVDALPISSIEIIVVSGSTDSNYHLETQLFPSLDQIKIHRSQPLGVFDAMNVGLTLYKGSWIWFLNSGDLCSIYDPNHFITILSKERDAKTHALLFYGTVRSTFRIYPSVKRPFLHSIIDKDKWFKFFPCMHSSIIVSSTSLSSSGFKYTTSKSVDADQEYIHYFQNLSRTRSYSHFISEFTLGGISTQGALSLLFRIFFRSTPRFISLIDDGLTLIKLFISDLIRASLCLR